MHSLSVTLMSGFLMMIYISKCEYAVLKNEWVD
jgi:hypothetical protein